MSSSSSAESALVVSNQPSLQWARTIADVEEIIKDYKNKSDKGKFSTAQIIVIGVVLHQGSAPAAKVVRTLVKKFGFVRKIAAQRLHADIMPIEESNTMMLLPNGFRREVRNALSAEQVPLYSSTSGIWSTNMPHARHFLNLDKDKRAAANGGIPPFLDIPLELREIVYKMIFVVRPGNLEVRRRNKRVTVKIHSEQTLPKDITPETFFALLLVCKQVNQEATEMFYEKNLWSFEHPRTMNALLERQASRMQHLTELRLFCDARDLYYDDEEKAKRCMQWIASSKKLRRLTIHINDYQWARDTQRVDRELAELKTIPAFAILMTVRGLEEVSFEGRCPRIRAALTPLLTLPRVLVADHHDATLPSEGDTGHTQPKMSAIMPEIDQGDSHGNNDETWKQEKNEEQLVSMTQEKQETQGKGKQQQNELNEEEQREGTGRQEEKKGRKKRVFPASDRKLRSHGKRT